MTYRDLQDEHDVEYLTRRGMGWSHDDAVKAADDHVQDLMKQANGEPLSQSTASPCLRREAKFFDEQQRINAAA